MATNGERPHLFVVIGGTGDLMKTKLLPALYRLHRQAPGNRVILGAARAELSDAQYADTVRDALVQAKVDQPGPCGEFASSVVHFQSLGNSGDDYAALARRITQIEKERGLSGNRVLYLAIPLPAVPPAVEGLARAGLNKGPGWTRIVVEKPFGRDLPSALELNRQMHAHFTEQQIYRIDHYLGKETVRNLLVFRFANSLFEPQWNRDRIERVEITVAEDNGVGSRGGFYETAGALRDIVQNHLTQILCLIAMEPPANFDADSIIDEKVKVLRSVGPLSSDDAVFAQYTRATINGKEVPGYLDEPGVPKTSRTETFVAIRMWIDNWRWQGVPFLVRTGKRLARKQTKVVVVFRRPPHTMFAKDGEVCVLHRNTLEMTLQPDEGFDFVFQVKVPGHGLELQPQRMHFRYNDVFGPLADAYETLLSDVATGDKTRFVRADEVEASWRLFAPLLDTPHPMHTYAAGTWGPTEAEGLQVSPGQSWRWL